MLLRYNTTIPIQIQTLRAATTAQHGALTGLWLSFGSLGVVDDLTGDRIGLPLHLRRQNELPLSGHPSLDQKAIEPRLIGCNCRHLAGHLGHATRPHIRLGCKDRSSVLGLLVPLVQKANRD